MFYVRSDSCRRSGFYVVAGDYLPRYVKPPKPPRKPRADKGRKRGPRKPRGAST